MGDGMIRIDDPARLGPVLGEIRRLYGMSRLGLAREIAEATGRSLHGVENQLKSWDGGVNAPTVTALAPLLAALGYDLALIPREDA